MLLRDMHLKQKRIIMAPNTYPKKWRTKTIPPKGLKNQEIILKELLAKSLVLFICIGLISGLAFGVYLLDVKNTSQLVFVEGPSISIVTENLILKKAKR